MSSPVLKSATVTVELDWGEEGRNTASAFVPNDGENATLGDAIASAVTRTGTSRQMLNFAEAVNSACAMIEFGPEITKEIEAAEDAFIQGATRLIEAWRNFDAGWQATPRETRTA